MVTKAAKRAHWELVVSARKRVTKLITRLKTEKKLLDVSDKDVEAIKKANLHLRAALMLLGGEA